MNRRLTLTAAALIAALGLTACGTGSTPAPRPTHTRSIPTAPPAPATVDPVDDPTPSLDRRELTRMSINYTWDNATPTDQRSMCNGIEMFGLDWSAEQLAKGGDSELLDWDYAAKLIEGKCAQ
ncbi:hypothetical protein [Streptomyces sp. NPDC093589]|uniref:hypothetical protein n=1 Tax=Streptomyces sp. NPDC093589 TaxID=3366043 RepID=UPI003800FD23